MYESCLAGAPGAFSNGQCGVDEWCEAGDACERYTGAHFSAAYKWQRSLLLGVRPSQGDISCEVSHQLYVARVFLWRLCLLLAMLIREFDTSDRRKLPSTSVSISWKRHTAFVISVLLTISVWMVSAGDAGEYSHSYISLSWNNDCGDDFDCPSLRVCRWSQTSISSCGEFLNILDGCTNASVFAMRRSGV